MEEEEVRGRRRQNYEKDKAELPSVLMRRE